jgi:excisionase family DNA binding protein
MALDYVDVATVARVLSTSEMVILQWIAHGAVEATMVGGQYLVPSTELDFIVQRLKTRGVW